MADGWTYDAEPGTSNANERRDAVRLLIGDTDCNDQLLQDTEIAFALTQAGDNVNLAGSLAARNIAGKFARRVDTGLDGARTAHSQRSKAFERLAAQLKQDAKLSGGALGVAMGGISEETMDSVDDDADRVQPAFKRGAFRNPSRFADDLIDNQN